MADYPQLIRFDPLVVRITDTSLMISNVIFNAECVRGLAFTGFRIYASCVGNPIYEETVEVEQNASTDNAMRAIKAKVKEWLGNLVTSLESPSRAVRMTSVKDSIDRAGWQQHCDMVGSKKQFNASGWDEYAVDFSEVVTDVFNRASWQTHYDMVGANCSFNEAVGYWKNGGHVVDDSGTIEGAILSTKDSIDRAGWQYHFDMVGTESSFDYISGQWASGHWVDNSGNIQDAILSI